VESVFGKRRLPNRKKKLKFLSSQSLNGKSIFQMSVMFSGFNEFFKINNLIKGGQIETKNI